MIKRRRFPKIFFGWWTVLASGILSMWAGGYSVYGFSALFKPIASELGYSRAVISVAASIGRFEGGFEAPVAGWLTDKFGPKWIVLFGVFLTSLSLILMNFIDSLWAFYVVWGVMLGTGVNLIVALPLQKAITNWFVKKRGVALSIRWMLGGLSGVLVLPLIGWLITVQGWRMTCVIGGVVMGFVGLPLAWFFIKPRRPEYYGLLPDGATVEEEAAATKQMVERGVKYAAEVEEVEFTLRQAMRTPAYWRLVVADASHGLASGVFIVHSIPFLTDMGIDPVRAAVIIATMVFVSMPSRFIGGLIGDHVKKGHLRFLLVGAYFLQAAGITAFLLNQTIAMVYVLFILYYLAFGATITLNSLIRPRYFGRKAFGSIQGTSIMFTTPFAVMSPIYAGWIYDTTGSYITAFTTFVALLALSAVVMSLARPPKPPAEVTDVHRIV